MPGLTADDERRLAALPKEASDALTPILGEPAAKWTMAKAAAVSRAVDLTGVRFTVVPPAESLSPAQRAMLELCATHAELGLQGGVYTWQRWSMRRWLGLDLPGALEAKGADDRARWQRLSPSDRGTDGDAVRALLRIALALGVTCASRGGFLATLGGAIARHPLAWLRDHLAPPLRSRREHSREARQGVARRTSDRREPGHELHARHHPVLAPPATDVLEPIRGAPARQPPSRPSDRGGRDP
jgi:hypothetical protein